MTTETSDSIDRAASNYVLDMDSRLGQVLEEAAEMCADVSALPPRAVNGELTEAAQDRLENIGSALENLRIEIESAQAALEGDVQGDDAMLAEYDEDVARDDA